MCRPIAVPSIVWESDERRVQWLLQSSTAIGPGGASQMRRYVATSTGPMGEEFEIIELENQCPQRNRTRGSAGTSESAVCPV